MSIMESSFANRRSFIKTIAIVPFLLDFKLADKEYIETVNSRIGDEQLGMALIHEHILVDFIGADKISFDRWNHEEVIKKVLPFLIQIKDRGIKSLFECTPAYIGRDVLLLQKLARKSGIQIITNTGFYGASDNKYLPSFAAYETAKQLANRWIAEFQNGIDGTDIKPGFIKIGVNPGALSELHQKLILAAAITHLATGLTICSHTGPAEPALQQLDNLQNAGVSPSAFVWVHARGSNEEMVKLAKRGCWISLDGVSSDNIDQHVTLIKYLKSEGFLSQILLSHDAGWYSADKPDGGEFRGFTTISDQLIPKLKTSGITEKDVDQLMIKNPANAFAIRIRKL